MNGKNEGMTLSLEEKREVSFFRRRIFFESSADVGIRFMELLRLLSSTATRQLAKKRSVADASFFFIILLIVAEREQYNDGIREEKFQKFKGSQISI